MYCAVSVQTNKGKPKKIKAYAVGESMENDQYFGRREKR